MLPVHPCAGCGQPITPGEEAFVTATASGPEQALTGSGCAQATARPTRTRTTRSHPDQHCRERSLNKVTALLGV